MRYNARKILNLDQAALALRVVLVALFLCLPSFVSAFFGDTEVTKTNIFGASSLGIELAVSTSEEMRSVVVLADEVENLEYSFLLTSAVGTFCTEALVTIERDGIELYDGSLSEFTTASSSSLHAGTTNELTFEFSVADEGDSYPGDCTVTFSYNANQVGYMHGQAFFDTETDTFTLPGSDFGVPAPAVASGVVLNEFLPRPDGPVFGEDDDDKPKGEWIELYNNGNDAVDLTGWFITDASGGGGNTIEIIPDNVVDHLSPETTVIPAKGFLVVYMNKPALNNTGDIIELHDDLGGLVDSVSYGEDPTACTNDPTKGEENDDSTAGTCDASNVPASKSFARIPDGVGPWIDPIPTPGSPNELDPEVEEVVNKNETEDSNFSFSSETSSEQTGEVPAALPGNAEDLSLAEPVQPPAEVVVTKPDLTEEEESKKEVIPEVDESEAKGSEEPVLEDDNEPESNVESKPKPEPENEPTKEVDPPEPEVTEPNT